MSTYKSDFLNVLAARGFIHQVSEPDVLDALAREKAITAYIGFDCTAPSLHIGSLVPIMLKRGVNLPPVWLATRGARAVAHSADLNRMIDASGAAIWVFARSSTSS